MAGQEGKAGYGAAVKAAGGPLGDDAPADEQQPDMFGDRAGPGRPKGAINRRTKELVDQMVQLGHKRPLQFLMERYNDGDAPIKERMAAAIACLPYVEQKQPLAIQTDNAMAVIVIGDPGADFDPAELAVAGAYVGDDEEDPTALVTVDVAAVEVFDDD